MFETETVRPCLVQKFKCGTMCEGSNFCRIENFNLKWAEFDFLKVADFVHFRVKFSKYIYTWPCSKKIRKCVKCEKLIID